ncbi:DUF6731 family protein [Paenibacillus sp. OV219]|uniref:DUF6731 family protein n=1 Tax=Paenibacillus sp. OV219 TaxID=1884377 RepID=UPI0008C5BB5E|nr:DUF6731 family protein [Paenibacillus sp. OV219]SEM81105.1 hypothetical protein SAMN05518847_101864 [Paenibacillus sp. OV219]
MSRTIHYYLCYILHNQKKTNIDFSDFVDRVMVLNPSKKFRNLKSGQFSMVEMVEPDPNNAQTAQHRSVAFGKYRDYKPYTGTKGTDTAELIKNDVLEITSTLFIPQSRLALIEYNHFGGRPKHLLDYLNSFLPNEEGNKWEVELVPLEALRGFGDVELSQDIRHIEFKLNLVNRIIPNNLVQPGRPESLFLDIFGKSIETNSIFGANTASISFGNGRARKDVIKPGNLIPLIKGLNLDDEMFESIKVKYKSPLTGNIEDIDLKHSDIYKRVILKDDDADGWEHIVEHMRQDYFANGRYGDSAHLKYANDLIVTKLPKIIESFSKKDSDETKEKNKTFNENIEQQLLV